MCEYKISAPRHSFRSIFLIAAISICRIASAQSVPTPRPLATYGTFKEVNLDDETYGMSSKSAETERLRSACQQDIGSSSFSLYKFNVEGKSTILLADSSAEGENFTGTSYSILANEKNCSRLGGQEQKNQPDVSGMMGIPEKSYRIALPIIGRNQELAYFLTEEKMVPGKYCVSSAECKVQRSYIYSRKLYKVNRNGFALMSSRTQQSTKDVSVEQIIPVGTLIK
ncbi:hypothetical protein [Ralstonia sp. SET104]|uniref:hypothetical protein n=1 Tax=Ralstonia sp. SET104 TaxID=2448774 RepID=UPI000F58B9EF|nr:hypothetical protein [Ralstonia sp. SET104]